MVVRTYSTCDICERNTLENREFYLVFERVSLGEFKDIDICSFCIKKSIQEILRELREYHKIAEENEKEEDFEP